MKLSSVVKALVLLVVLVFVANQVISSVYKPVKTESATYYTAVEGIKTTGFIVRNESLVTAQNNGVMHFLISDGERVSKDGIIANLYDNESSSITVSHLENLKEKIADIEDILSYNDVEAVNLDVMNTKVYNGVNGLITASGDGNYADITKASDSLLSALNRRQAALGAAGNFSAQLETLNAEYNSLAATLPAVKGSVYAAQSGYFVSKIDGYETVVNTSDLDKITPEFLSAITTAKENDGVIGKIVSDYEWYIAAQISINDSLTFKEGQTLKVTTSVKSAPELPVTVKKINTSSDNTKAVVLLYCDQMNCELATMRSGPMTIVKNEYEGLRVQKSALRVVNSKKGVYVVSGMQLKFVPVDVIYYGDDYIICSKNNDETNMLKLYDKVVVKGKKLYDGKIIS